jgi:hypothetical protein
MEKNKNKSHRTIHPKKLSPDQVRTERVEILLTPPERMLVEDALAKSKFSSLSHLVRQSVLIVASEIASRKIAPIGVNKLTSKEMVTNERR